ncbi:hypothetical protein JCM18904_3184 [Vibrio sp. JCM 18904]|nr:hypothetical protein JCM18904_3184 [Vibrio sp. JCM 18904]
MLSVKQEMILGGVSVNSHSSGFKLGIALTLDAMNNADKIHPYRIWLPYSALFFKV